MLQRAGWNNTVHIICDEVDDIIERYLLYRKENLYP